ncbi:hypothetical protein MASR2M18_04700 [Ignavibacteria bacterium]|nr:PH domain-containing protein [Bacteroidota bacterium]MCZ2131751.1 PH domain-containing protein [Bacteroidota bacterium]
MYILDPSVKSVWGIVSFLNRMAFSVSIFFAEAALRSFDVLPFPVGTVSGLSLVLGLAYTFIMPSLSYRYMRFDVQGDDLVLEQGVFTRVRTVIPYRRIQHTDVRQGVVERFYGLASLVVYTAGTRTAAAVIPGLSAEYAEELRNHLRQFAAEEDTL